MLLIKTYIERSAIHGMGLFSDEFIPEGTVVWKLMPGLDLVVPETSLEQLPAVVRDYVDRYGYLNEASQGYVLCGDDARFFNHSDYPNTVSLSHEMSVAIRDIARGEELTCNYYEFDRTAANHFSREQAVEWRNGTCKEVAATTSIMAEASPEDRRAG